MKNSPEKQFNTRHGIFHQNQEEKRCLDRKQKENSLFCLMNIKIKSTLSPREYINILENVVITMFKIKEDCLSR